MELVELKIQGISYSDNTSGAFALILQETNGSRKLPIVIGGFEAQAIAIGLEKKIKTSRPLTHELFKSFADKFSIKLNHIIISKLTDGVFFSPIWIDGEISKGYHEVNVTYDERIIGKSEIFITTPIIIYAEFGSKPIKISQDMFIESNNKVGVNILGLVKGSNNTNQNSVELTILHPDGQIENVQIDTAKWGYYSHTLPITDKWETGTYVISANFDGEKLGHIYMQITDFDINWFKIFLNSNWSTYCRC